MYHVYLLVKTLQCKRLNIAKSLFIHPDFLKVSYIQIMKCYYCDSYSVSACVFYSKFSDVFLNVHHSIDLFQVTKLMHTSYIL